jgi:predicted permease
MQGVLDILSFSASVTGPIFIILGLGQLLMRLGVLNDRFIEAGSRLVFLIALPVLLFLSLSGTRIDAASNLSLVGLGLIITLTSWLLLEWLAGRWVQPPRDRGVVVQGAFRSNMGVVGLAYCLNAYGQAGLATASLYLGAVTILYNVLAIVTLHRSIDQRRPDPRRLALAILRNPIIIGIVAGLLASLLSLQLPGVLNRAAGYLADLTLPLALLCTGAALDFRALQAAMRNTAMATVGKLIFIPVIFTGVALLAGQRGVELGIIMLMASAPTAAASYVMVRALGGNASLAANIIALTTLGSIVTTSLGIMVLRGLGLM